LFVVLLVSVSFVFLFFFQAEDGIRDFHVTGVQTCALPISAVFQSLVQPLIDNPVPAGNGRTMNFYQATGGVGAGLYTSEAWPRVIDGIAQLKNEGRGDKLLSIVDDFTGRTPDGTWSNFIEANLAINCNDEERRTPEQEAELRRQIFEVNPFFDTGRPVAG